MVKDLSLTIEKRSVTGRKVKSLRNQGLLPGNIYGKKIKSQAVQMNGDDFSKVFAEAGETNLVNLTIKSEKSPRPVLITNLQKHNVTDVPLHVDFHQVDITQKVMVSVPIVVVGESSAVKEKGGVLITLLDEIKVEALPTDLPNEIKVDISHLKEMNDSVLVKDLNIDTSKVTLEVKPEETVVTVKEPTEEEVALVEEASVEGEETAKETEEEAEKSKPEEEKKSEEK